MRLTAFIAIFAIAIPTVSAAQSSHSVRGYIKSNGTYIAPTRATNPNRTKVDNYSSKPNVNPYSGAKGTRDPYAPKSPKSPKY